MGKSILVIDEMHLEDWISSGKGEGITVKNNTMEVSQGQIETYVMAYRDRMGNLRSIQENMGEYNTYEVTSEMTVEGEIEVEVGVSKYYNNGQSDTVFYKPKEMVSFLSEGIASLYLTLRLKGSGTIHFKQISIEAQSKVYWNDDQDKVKKLEKFYTWYTHQNLEVESEIVPNNPIKIATILDEFSFECFKYEAQVMQLSYNNWRQEIEDWMPDLLLVESAWQGKNGTWANRIARFGAYYDGEVKALITYCKEKKIPTVFWDKEGLTNFHYFINTASLFDYVGVTDENVLEIHQAMHPISNVFILPFAAQPRLHNSKDRMMHPLGKLAFAGSWYGEKYPSRMKEMEMIVKPALLFGVDIYDRNYDKQSTLSDKLWKWPAQYDKAIVGKLPYQVMSEVYKQYPVFLNVQSVNDSQWMVPRRVYELLACGTTVISSYSSGIAHQFAEEVYMSHSEDETIELITKVLRGGADVRERAQRGQLKVLAQHTYKQRLEKILEKINS